MHQRAPAAALIVLLAVAGCATTNLDERHFPPAPEFPPDHRYTLDELIELSVHRNPGLEAARYESEAAQGLVDQVKALWLPALRYDFAAVGYSNDLSYKAKALNLVSVNVPITGAFNIENSLNYAQILTTFGKRTSGLKQTRMLAEIVKLQVLAQQDCVACEVATLYYLVCLANDIDRILDDALRRLGVFRQVAEELNRRGSLRADQRDVLQATLLINELEQLRILVQAARQTSYAALKRTIGLDRDEPLALNNISLPPPMTYGEAVGVSATIAKGFLARPETRQMDLVTEIGHEQVKFAKTLFYPNIAALGTYVDSQGNHHTILSVVDGLIASIVLDVPIYDPASRARLRTALYVERASEAIQRLIEQLLVLEIEATALEAQRSLKTVFKTQRALQTAIEHEQTNRQAYSRDLVQASDVIVAIGVSAFAKVQHQTAVFAYHSARARLNRVTANREDRYGW